MPGFQDPSERVCQNQAEREVLAEVLGRSELGQMTPGAQRWQSVNHLLTRMLLVNVAKSPARVFPNASQKELLDINDLEVSVYGVPPPAPPLTVMPCSCP